MGKRGYTAAQIQGVLEKAAEATRVARARTAARLEVAPGGVGGAASGAVGDVAPGVAGDAALPPSPMSSASGVDSGDSSETITAQSGRWWLG